jgi:hypothetical protein
MPAPDAVSAGRSHGQTQSAPDAVSAGRCQRWTQSAPDAVIAGRSQRRTQSALKAVSAESSQRQTQSPPDAVTAGQYKDHLDFINIGEIGEAQAMMEMVRHDYIGNLQHVSTDIMRMRMDPEFWYQQHNFDSDAHHLKNNMIDMVQKYTRRDATRMETYIDLGAVVYESKHCRGIFARSKLTMEFNLCMLISTICLTIHVIMHRQTLLIRSKYGKKRSLYMIPSNHCRPSHRF